MCEFAVAGAARNNTSSLYSRFGDDMDGQPQVLCFILSLKKGGGALKRVLYREYCVLFTVRAHFAQLAALTSNGVDRGNKGKASRRLLLSLSGTHSFV